MILKMDRNLSTIHVEIKLRCPVKIVENVLLDKDGNIDIIANDRLDRGDIHGTGCALATAIACFICLIVCPNIAYFILCTLLVLLLVLLLVNMHARARACV